MLVTKLGRNAYKYYLTVIFMDLSRKHWEAEYLANSTQYLIDNRAINFRMSEFCSKMWIYKIFMNSKDLVCCNSFGNLSNVTINYLLYEGRSKSFNPEHDAAIN